MNPPLHAIKCPERRPRGLDQKARCGCVVIPGEDYAYCNRCGTFFRVIREPGKELKLKKMDKNEIKFMWILCSYQE
jgi:hypothetical protein